MIAGPNPDHEFAKRHPDIFNSFKKKAEELNKGKAREQCVVISLVVGAWLGVFLVSSLADVHFAAITKASGVMLAISLGYYAYNKWSWYRMKKDFAKGLEQDIFLREHIEKHGPPPW